MKSNPIFIFLTSIIVTFLTVQLSPTPAIAGGKWKQVPADEARIVLKGWPEADQFKYYKGWHTDNWPQECEQAFNWSVSFKTVVQLCRLFPRFYYNAQTSYDDISKDSYWNWKQWKGSEITPGQDTKIEHEDPRVFRHIDFTQYGNNCQYMTHVRMAGGTRGSHEGGYLPLAKVMTCNLTKKLK